MVWTELSVGRLRRRLPVRDGSFAYYLCFLTCLAAGVQVSDYFESLSVASLYLGSRLFVIQLVSLLSQGYIRHYSNNHSERH
ncbi:hypothetical protein F4803DRAFT_181450 [Xylaria telfairii]|nr:hypothetical protein F4803DRAFT_181450 [Xylaria telfairii]